MLCNFLSHIAPTIPKTAFHDYDNNAKEPAYERLTNRKYQIMMKIEKVESILIVASWLEFSIRVSYPRR